MVTRCKWKDKGSLGRVSHSKRPNATIRGNPGGRRGVEKEGSSPVIGAGERGMAPYMPGEGGTWKKPGK